MAIEVKHATESVGGPYTPEGELGPAEWNELHDLAGDAETLLYFDAEGDAVPLALGENLSVDEDEGTFTLNADGGGGIVFTRVTGTTLAEAGRGYIADTSGGAFTITLPESPAEGDQVVIADGGEWGEDNLTVARNGSTIEGEAEDLILDISGVSVTFLYDGSTWQVYAQAGAQADNEPFAGQWVEVARAVADNDATIDFTGIDSSADEWMVSFSRVAVENDGEVLYLRTSTDGGSSFASGAADYLAVTGTLGYIAVSTNGVGNTAGEFCNGEVSFRSPSQASKLSFESRSWGVYIDGGGSFIQTRAGARNANEVINAIRIYNPFGNISSGTFVLLKRIKP